MARDLMYNSAPLREMTAEKARRLLGSAHALVRDTRVADLRYQAVGPWLMKKYFEGDKAGYLEHMANFNLPVLENLGCGIWCFDPGGTRFYERKPQVHPQRTLTDQLATAINLKRKFGLSVLQAHYASREWKERFGITAEVDEDTIGLYKQCEREGGPRLKHLAGFTFKPAMFEFGGGTNPKRETRNLFTENVVGMLKMCREHDLYGAIWWPGGDGFRNIFGVPHVVIQELAAEALAEALDTVPGVPVLLETKGYEPAMNNHIPTTMEGILFAQKVESLLRDSANTRLLKQGIPLVQLQPEVGHERMVFQKVAKVWSQAAGRLLVSHENDQPEGNFDQDRVPGTIDRNGLDARLYALMQMGFRGDFVLDIMPEVEPIERAVECAVEEYRGSIARISRLNHEKVMDSIVDEGNHRGELEIMLARAANPSLSSP